MKLESIEPESWLNREVFARFGVALYFSQVLEYRIVALILWTGIRDSRYRTLEESEAETAELFKLTMGKVRQTLMSRRPDAEHLEEELTRAVRMRNFLAHEYFLQRVGVLHTEAGRIKMLEELGKAAAFFEDVGDKIESLTEQIVEAAGWDQRLPEIRESIEQEGFGGPLPGL
jgi:hypothetical protein